MDSCLMLGYCIGYINSTAEEVGSTECSLLWGQCSVGEPFTQTKLRGNSLCPIAFSLWLTGPTLFSCMHTQNIDACVAHCWDKGKSKLEWKWRRLLLLHSNWPASCYGDPRHRLVGTLCWLGSHSNCSGYFPQMPASIKVMQEDQLIVSTHGSTKA